MAEKRKTKINLKNKNMKTKILLSAILILLMTNVVLSQKNVNLTKVSTRDTVWSDKKIKRNYRMSDYIHYTYGVNIQSMGVVDCQLILLKESKDTSRSADIVFWPAIFIIISLVMMIVSNINNSKDNADVIVYFAFIFAIFAVFAAAKFIPGVAIILAVILAVTLAFVFVFAICVCMNLSISSVVIFIVAVILAVTLVLALIKEFALATLIFGDIAVAAFTTLAITAFALVAFVVLNSNTNKIFYKIFSVLYYISVIAFFAILYWPLIF